MTEMVDCLQVDGALLSHPGVAEAVSFGAPDEKYGEVVAAAVVPSKQVDDVDAFIADVKKHAGSKLAKFKVRVTGAFLPMCKSHCMAKYTS